MNDRLLIIDEVDVDPGRRLAADIHPHDFVGGELIEQIIEFVRPLPERGRTTC